MRECVVASVKRGGRISTTLIHNVLRFLPKIFETCSSFVDSKQKQHVELFCRSQPFSWKISGWKISGSRVEALAHERRRTSIMFAGRRSIGVNLYARAWNTTLRFTAVPWTTSCLRRSEREGGKPVREVSCNSDPGPRSLSGAFFTLFWDQLLDGALIDCDPDQWQWLDSCPNTGSIMPLPLPSLSGTEGVLSLSLSSHSSVYSVQPLPDPVNVWSVSSHTCSLISDPSVKKFFFKYTTLKGLCRASMFSHYCNPLF